MERHTGTCVSDSRGRRTVQGRWGVHSAVSRRSLGHGPPPLHNRLEVCVRGGPHPQVNSGTGRVTKRAGLKGCTTSQLAAAPAGRRHGTARNQCGVAMRPDPRLPSPAAQRVATGVLPCCRCLWTGTGAAPCAGLARGPPGLGRPSPRPRAGGCHRRARRGAPVPLRWACRRGHGLAVARPAASAVHDRHRAGVVWLLPGVACRMR